MYFNFSQSFLYVELAMRITGKVTTDITDFLLVLLPGAISENAFMQ